MLTWQDHEHAMNLDAEKIGTEAYRGIAWFWNYEYRHYLRDSSPYRRRLVHHHLLKAGLSPSDYSRKHTEIVLKYARPDGSDVRKEPTDAWEYEFELLD